MESEETQSNATKPPAITSLPVELVRQILSDLRDVDSLCSAAFSCSSLYHIFIADEAAIVEQVLLNQVFSPLIPELLTAHRSSLLLPTADDALNRETFRDTVHQLLHERRVPNLKLSLKEGICVASLHAHVEDFARKFASSAMKTPSLSQTSEDHITPRESLRTCRAFYWFEILCNYFRTLWREGDSIFSVFGCMFAPWEAEQLACVHDYMARVIMPGQ